LAVRRGVAVQEASAMAECAGIAATQSRSEWRELVHTGSRFYDYFRAVTPIDVIERMQVGSYLNPRALRPGVDTVPASVWVYAWSQSRHMLPGWFGSGAGLQAVRSQRGIEALRRCYRGWPFFRALIDDIEVMLALTDLQIAAYYDALAPADLRGYSAQIRAEYLRTCELVLEIKECKSLLDSDQTLQRSIALRNPYEDPVNLMQVDLLRRWRESGREDRPLFEALVASVGGVARGLQTTG
jgi:phosphoenolpyruvate carboxylase